MFLQQIIGAAISEVILQFLNENNTLTRKMHGQGYDGASNMSSNVAGVQASIKKVAPLFTYIQCNGHCFSLIVSKSCRLPQTQNVYGCMQKCCSFFLNELVILNCSSSTTEVPLNGNLC